MKKNSSILFLVLLVVILLVAVFESHGSTPSSQVSHPLIPTARASALKGVCFRNPDISVFMYHYIREVNPKEPKTIQNLSINPRTFESQLLFVQNLVRSGSVSVARLSQFPLFEKTGCWPNQNIFVFTSDDGWEDSYTTLFPLARKYRIPFHLGIITSRIGHPGFVSESEIRTMHASRVIDILSHSVQHLDQDTMDAQNEIREICDSKSILEKQFGQQILGYIYPAGRSSKNSARLLRLCGYTYAFNTKNGVDSMKALEYSPYSLERIRVTNDWKPERFLKYVR